MTRTTQVQPRAPLAFAAAAFACGIWLSRYLQPSSQRWGWAGILLALCAIVSVAARSIRLAQLAALLALFCAGSFALVWAPVPAIIVPPRDFLEGKVEIVGHVTNDGVLSSAGNPRERIDLTTESIRMGDTVFTLPVGMRATMYSREAKEENADSGASSFPLLA